MIDDEPRFRLKWFQLPIQSDHPAPGFVFEVFGYYPAGHPAERGECPPPIIAGRVCIAGTWEEGAQWNGLAFRNPVEAIRSYESVS